MKNSVLSKKDIIVMAGIFALVITIVVFAGRFADRQYRDNLAKNSAQQMIEYGDQVTAALSNQTAVYWDEAGTVAYLLDTSKYTEAEQLLSTLGDLTKMWDLSNIILYTETGSCYTENGAVINLDSASSQIYQAQANGKFDAIVGSQIYYMVPADVAQTIHGSKIVAVSVVKDLSGIIGGMNLNSYNKTAKVYFTQLNGLVISKNANGESNLNIESAYDKGTMSLLIGSYSSFSDAIRGNETCAFLYRSGSQSSYVIILPVRSGTDKFNLIIDAPTSAVDQSMNRYSSFLSILYIVLFICVALVFILLFYYFYRQRVVSVNEILMRERMLNLLVSRTNNVFALFSVKQAAPIFVSQNQAAVTGSGSKRLLHITPEGKLQFSFEQSGDPEFLAALNKELLAWDGKGTFKSDYLRAEVEGEIKYLEVCIYPTHQPDADYIVTNADVTREYDREEALRVALAMADDASKAKTTFLSNMSHDIRTPMNAIVNMTDFALENRNDPERLEQYLNTIKLSSNHLLTLINNVLDMSRIESGKMELDAEPFDITEQIRQTAGIIEPLCSKKHQEFTCTFHLQHRMLKGDPLKSRQIVINLLNNASKFTPEGGRVSLEVNEEKGLSERHIIIRITVRDSGIGMTEEEARVIFEPFRRLQNSQSRRAEGSGLGLSICKSFTEAMGGSISVQSQLGKGSEFTVLLPFEIVEGSVPAPAPEERESLPEASFTGKHALLCEDNEINRQIACMLLGSLGFMVDTAEDGKIGFQKFLASSPGTYDMIFMDIQMPEMNGYDTAIAIRASGHPQARSIPIIAMTANVFKEDVERARESGMNAHIGKPLEKSAIIRAVSESIHQEEASDQ